MQINTEMTSSRPYLLRALNEWILDNDLTPHIVVDATYENVVVPTQYVEADKIVLNISPGAVSNFNITNEYICFSARFSGKAMEIFVPVTAVLALYSKENGQGMVFNEEKANPASASSVASKPAQTMARSSAKPEFRKKPSIAKVTDTNSESVRRQTSTTTSTRPRLTLVD